MSRETEQQIGQRFICLESILTPTFLAKVSLAESLFIFIGQSFQQQKNTCFAIDVGILTPPPSTHTHTSHTHVNKHTHQ